MTSDADPTRHETDRLPRRDSLTIGRFLLLTAGLAVGLGVFVPADENTLSPVNLDNVLGFCNAVLIGLALPAPLIVLGQILRKGPPIGPGGLFALTMGLGALLMLPPVLVKRLQSENAFALMCLYYMMPLVSFWYLTAALIAGKLKRSLFSRSTAWTERYGFFLAALWTPLGIWWLFAVFYAEAFR